MGICHRLDESDRDKIGVGASMYPATGTAPRKRPSPEDDPSHAGRSAHTGSASAPNRNSEVRISASARCCQCSWRPKSWMCPNARPVALCTAVGTLRGRGRLVHDGALSPAATCRTIVMRSMRCFALERVVLGWLHCGCTALQPAVLPCNMAFGVAPCRIGVRRTQGVRHGGTPRVYAKGYASPNGARHLSRGGWSSRSRRPRPADAPPRPAHRQPARSKR